MNRTNNLNSEGLILAADFGTTGVKIGVVDAEFHLLATAVEPYPLALSEGGCAEQNPEDWWQAFCRATRRLTKKHPQLAPRIGSLVFAAQMCGVICADDAGTPLRPCLVWLDKRSAGLAGALVGGFPQVQGYQLAKLLRWIRIANGAPSKNGMDPTSKMLWIKANEPDIYQKTTRFLDVRDWLAHRATGVFSTTADSANLTWMMDTRPGREGWSERLSQRVGLPLSKMPPIVDGCAVLGLLTTNSSQDLGLPTSVKLVAGGGDVTATALGSGAVEDGALHLCISSSSWVSGFFPKRILSVSNAYATITSSPSFRPLLVATQENAGSALAWLCQMIEGTADVTSEQLNDFYSDIGEIQSRDPMFLPWLAGERVPVDDDRLRGAFFGLSLHHDRNAMKRAAIEGVAMNSRWAYAKVIRTPGAITSGPLRLVGGGAQNPHLAQTLANVLNREISVGNPQFTGVLGAATMAAPAMGWYPDVWTAARAIQNQSTATYRPQPDRVDALNQRYKRLQKIRKNLVRLYQQDT